MIDQKPFIRAGVPTNQHPNISTTNYSQPPPPPPPPPPSTTDLNHHLRCPRCDSSNTKFCYYNNYNLTQPRYFCKTCRRYWTRGGALRNVPIGGGCRKNKGATIAAALAKQISSATGKLTDIQKSNFINNLQRSKPILWPNYSPQTSHLLSLLNPNPNPNPSFASLNENLFNPIWRNCEMVRDQRHENGTHEVKIKGENNAGELMHQELRSFPLSYNYDHGDDQVVAEPVTNGSVSTTSVANGESGFWNMMIPWSDLSIANSTAYP